MKWIAFVLIVSMWHFSPWQRRRRAEHQRKLQEDAAERERQREAARNVRIPWFR